MKQKEIGDFNIALIINFLNFSQRIVYNCVILLQTKNKKVR